MGTTSDHEMKPGVRLWWWYFNRDIQHRWGNTLFLTALACGLFWRTGRPWLFLVVGGAETTGYVVRERDAVRYEVGGQSYTIREWGMSDGYPIWGDPVKVQYLSLAPGVSWCPNWEDRELLTILLIVFVAFVAAPLAWLWRINIVCPALDALRKVRAARADVQTEATQEWSQPD